MAKEVKLDLHFARLLVVAGIVESRLKEDARVSIQTFGRGAENFIQLVVWNSPLQEGRFTHTPGIPTTALLDKDKIQPIAKWVLKQIKAQCPEYFDS